jgi:hypothetical protein
MPPAGAVTLTSGKFSLVVIRANIGSCMHGKPAPPPTDFAMQQGI